MKRSLANGQKKSLDKYSLKYEENCDYILTDPTLSSITGMWPWNLTERSRARCLRSHRLRDGIIPNPSSSP